MRTKTATKTANWLNKYRQVIELEPFFQRSNVWNKAKQQYFIDTILRGWGTPKLFLWEKDKDIFFCLDGKQRLTSLFSFMTDQLQLSPKYSESHGSKKYSELQMGVQDKVDNYKFSVEILTEAKPDEVIELYKRLQGGTPLNFGEKLFAIPGNMNEFIKRRLARKSFFRKNIALLDNRYSHYAICAQLCLLSMKGAREDLKLKNLEKLFREYSSFDHKNPEARKIVNVINYLEKAFPSPKEPALRNKANIISVFFLVSDLLSRGNITGRAKEIGSFFERFVKDIQKEFKKKPEDRDGALLSYQQAVTQGQDKIKSINIRHNILLKKLAEKNKFFYRLLYPPTSPEDNFRRMYQRVSKKFKVSSITGLDRLLISKYGIKPIKCSRARAKETIVGHIRNCIHHKEHGSLGPKDLVRANKILETAL